MEWILRTGKPKGDRRDPYIRVNSAAHLVEIAEDGLGIVTLANENRNLINSSLVRVLPEIKGPSIKAYFIYHNHLEHSKNVKALEKHLREIVAQNGWDQGVAEPDEAVA